MERLACSLDKLGDLTLLNKYKEFLDDYEEFLAAKSHAELEEEHKDSGKSFKEKAQHFDNFLHAVFASDKLDRNLVRYLII
ncbi:MAG: hypothetical protein A2711_00250 [Burkholderiales bacterium RIFCSPHIGHO2_01_FULL_63_240]|nr:MAG: hypothetical protein A2711_00250 [Burkholderiales bacterium RIFCSPHIGHO2_01_FULL_63_240]